MRIATYNVEWFNDLFDDFGRPFDDAEPSARYRTSRHAQYAAVMRVFAALDADAVMVIEAPDLNRRSKTVAALEGFAANAGLRARRVLTGFPNETRQEIALLYDPDRLKVRHDPQGSPVPGEPGVPRFDGSWRIDLDIDGTLDTVRFSKPPLEVAATSAAGTGFRLIGVHLKSKAPHGVSDPARATRIAIENRRKQLAESHWLRQRIEAHLDACDPLIVMGDFNDGPGLDEYEALFGRSGLEIVQGLGEEAGRRLYDPHARLRTAAHATAAAPSSARFWLDSEKQFFSAMLDFLLISPPLLARRPKWRIWHPFDDPEIYADTGLREALLAASDHFPVTIDLDL